MIGGSALQSRLDECSNRKEILATLASHWPVVDDQDYRHAALLIIRGVVAQTNGKVRADLTSHHLFAAWRLAGQGVASAVNSEGAEIFDAYVRHLLEIGRPDDDVATVLRDLDQLFTKPVEGATLRRTAPSRVTTWTRDNLRAALHQLIGWSRLKRLPAYYSCNEQIVWPSTGKGWSSPHERSDKTGKNRLLDEITAAVRRQRPGGGRFSIQADGVYCANSGRKMVEWDYVPPPW